jgi:mRNA interferase HigB
MPLDFDVIIEADLVLLPFRVEVGLDRQRFERWALSAVPLERWYRLVKAANWTSMDDIRRAAPKVKVPNRDRARFEVADGNYRLIAAFDFRRQIVFVKFIGTHAEYDAIDSLTVARF